MAKGTKQATGRATSATSKTGPPWLLVGLGYASVVVSLPLVVLDGIATHLVGYATGALVPILIIGLTRRIDLDRRRSPRYEASAALRPALAILAIAAMVAAGLHIWPIATELAS